MNREERRKTARELKSKMGYECSISDISKMVKLAFDSQSSPLFDFDDGDKATLNVDAIINKSGFSEMNEEYKRFVLDNKDTVFTVHTEHGRMVSFLEEPRWLFIKDDLIKVREV